MGNSSSSSAPSSNPLGACAAGGQKKPQITFEPKTRAPMPRLSDCHAAIEEGHRAFRQKLRRLVAGQTGEIPEEFWNTDHFTTVPWRNIVQLDGT